MRFRALCVSFALALSVACVGRPPEVPEPEEVVTAGQTVLVQLAGRPFRLTPLKADIDARPVHALEIVGDGMVVSCTVPGTPAAPAVVGDTVTFGGHTFSATRTPNEFLLDGRAQSLPAGGVYAVSNGELVTRLR